MVTLVPARFTRVWRSSAAEFSRGRPSWLEAPKNRSRAWKVCGTQGNKGFNATVFEAAKGSQSRWSGGHTTGFHPHTQKLELHTK